MVVPLTEQITSKNHEESGTTAKPRVSDSTRNGDILAHSSTGRVISCLREAKPRLENA
ncbi:3850_t:CDS:2 [Paraglomus brasilianum]|uniref:3850_t:CDS:1 n=1 Tax=Paraglomus brasilianum TaxID=144538 RepID=A0A9N9BP76_9GLOM|nr:3850_t:CDS:2 [Paraglomus brasilianum]